MGFAHFFYAGDWDADDVATAAQDKLIKACVAFEDECHDTDAMQAVIKGQRSVWVGAREIAAEEDDDFELDYADSAQAAERLYRETFLRCYVRCIRRSYPKYETDGEGMAWWPECLPYDSLWPRRLLGKLALVMGEIEAEKSLAAARYFEQQDAQQASAANKD
jgi:hypothetical protein